MVPGWLFRLVQSLLLIAKVLYWQVYVAFVTIAQGTGFKDVQPKLNKIPSRVALCVELDKSSEVRRKRDSAFARAEYDRLIDKCAVACMWCFDAGVDDVTIFENTGVLDHGIDLFRRRLQEKIPFPRLIFGKLNRLRAVKLYKNGDLEPSAVISCASVEEATEEVSVRLLSDEDSERDIARLAKQLVDEKDVSPSVITEGFLDARLSASRGNVDKINLILTYSISPNMLGFPPWLMRTPEILNIGESIVQTTYASFVWAMFKYSKTEQRWGR